MKGNPAMKDGPMERPEPAAHCPPAVTELRLGGYAVLPAPRRVELTGKTVVLDGDWGLQLVGMEEEDIAVRTFQAELSDTYGFDLPPRSADGQAVRLAIEAGAVATGCDDERNEQAYRLTIDAETVDLVANAPAGLFYGVQTLVQLLAGDGCGPLRLPCGAITDWPAHELRFVHWDTKHHQDRIETLKRTLDWMARFKLNAVSFELEDKFAYPSHPVIGCPGAFTTAELQELVDYGLERHIQIVPNLQAPAHLCYVLKHEQFAHLRCDGSNYQICMDEPEARRLLFDLYDDLCEATRGVRYFHVSTDEVYYAGICERFRKPYNAENRSLTWVDYVLAAHEHLANRGRRVLIWAEYPLLDEHVKLLPADLINGILGPGVKEEFVRALDERGIDCLAYSSMQGEERLFPNHLGWVDGEGSQQPGRLAEAFERTARPSRFGTRRPIGTFAAAWDDSGLHGETFWLGWAAMGQFGWHPAGASVEQTVADFMDLYYGRAVRGMADVYRAMQDQARFWERSWARVPSTVRGPAYGYSAAKRPVERRDLTLPTPPLPSPQDLEFFAVYTDQYEEEVMEAADRLAQSDRLLAALHENLPRATRNRHNLEVLLSLAGLIRAHLELLAGLGEVEERFERAQDAHEEGDPAGALAGLTKATGTVRRVLESTDAAYRELVGIWEKSRTPRNAPVGGREFLHVMDDVKDHFADRRADLSYHLAPFETIGLREYADELEGVVHSYARRHGLGAHP